MHVMFWIIIGVLVPVHIDLMVCGIAGSHFAGLRGELDGLKAGVVIGGSVIHLPRHRIRSPTATASL